MTPEPPLPKRMRKNQTMSTSTTAAETAIQEAASSLTAAAADLVTTQSEAIARAVALVMESLTDDGIVQVFGTGHSKGFAMEIAGRAGGLVPANQLAIKDVVMLGDRSPADVVTPEAERRPGFAHEVLALHRIHPADVFMIASNSGGNGVTVEMALEAQRRGHKVIAVTSLRHSERIASRHPSGKRLFEIADVVIDNCAPFGDASRDVGGGLAVTSVSTVTAAYVAQMITAGVVAEFQARGEGAPVLVSANIAGGDAHNEALWARYAGRINEQEP